MTGVAAMPDRTQQGSGGAGTTPQVPEAVTTALAAMRLPIMISHVVPDADALGSMLAMALAWRTDNVQPKAAIPSTSLSSRLAFLVGWADVPLATPDDFAAADGFVTLDTARKDRCNVGRDLKETDWSAGRPMVNIDHHNTNTAYGSVNWVEGSASSSCELVYHLIRAAGRPLTPVIASLLYAGIQTDTLGFSLPTTTPSSLHAAADLVAAGAAVGELGERLGRSQRPNEFGLLRVIYENTKVVADGQIAYSTADYHEIQSVGCTAADIDDQINVPRSLDGVRLAMLFTEGNQGRTRINFRGSDRVTVVELAAEFGGGGHAQAAGAVLDGGIETSLARVLPRAIEHMKKFVRRND